MREDDDIVGTPWVIDPAVRIAMRLEAVRDAFADGRLDDATVEAEELLTESPDHVETLTILVDITLEDGDSAGAVEIYEHVLRLTPPTAAILSGLALARLESVDIHGAISAAQEAVRLQADLAEAHYTLSIALEFVPRRAAEVISALSAAHQLAPEDYPLPLPVRSVPWEEIVGRAAAELDDETLEFWSGVPVHIEDLPKLGELTSGPVPIPPTVRGLFVGAPEDGHARPDALRLFATNLARLGDEDAIVQAIADVFDNEAHGWRVDTV